MMSEMRVEPSSGKRDFFALYEEEGLLWRMVHKSLYSKMLKDGFQRLDCQEFKARFLEKEPGYAKVCALQTLSRRSCFEVELKARLIDKGFCQGSVAEAIDYAKHIGALCDETRLRSVIEKLIGQGKGKRMILAYLARYHFDPQAVAECLQGLSFNPREEIARLLQKKIRNLSLQDPVQRRKMVLFLQRKGFGLDDILSVIHAK